MNIIKVCPDPNCDSVYHNVPAKATKCLNCDGWIIKINENTYKKKFIQNFFQYDYITNELIKR
jgi:hypothetical protein